MSSVPEASQHPALARSSRSVTSAEAALQRIDWKIVRRLDGLLQGEHQSLFTGHGLDLAGIREYQFGDDIRMMDWNVTARTGRAHLREYQEDREIAAWLVLDTSASVAFGTARVPKSGLEVEFAGALTRLLTRQGNRVGAIFFSGGVDAVIPPRRGRQQALAILDKLFSTESTAPHGLTRLAEVLDRAGKFIRRRSLVFIVSDFLADPTWEAPLQRLRQRHEVTAVWLRDPREEEMPDIGAIYFEDAETGEQIYVDTQSRRFRSNFRATAERRRALLESIFARHGVECLSLHTDRDTLADLVQFARGRPHRLARRVTLSGVVR
jgi:uncharacterized protein (DUF58 family)